MALQSQLFTRDRAVNNRLNECLNDDSKHVAFGDRGAHVSAIQSALFLVLPGLRLPDNELSDPLSKEGFYGSATAAAVFKYKSNHRPPIINKSYQDAPDSIVGKMTIQALDDDLRGNQPVVPPPVAPVDKSIKTVTLWLNAFIHKNVKNADGSAMSFPMSTGPHKGETAIPGPFNGMVPFFDDCYLTDQRSFDATNKLASSRIHAEVKIDFTGTTPTLTAIPPFGATVDTVRLRVSTGEVLNTGRGVARGGFTKDKGFVEGSKEVTVRYKVAGKNPIAKMPRVAVIPGVNVPVPLPPSSIDPPSLGDPDIDMLGEFTIDADLRTLKFKALLDGFPFFEAYAAADGATPIVIFQKEPDPGQSPLTGLPGPPNRLVDVDKKL